MIFNFVIHHILLYKKGNIRYNRHKNNQRWSVNKMKKKTVKSVLAVVTALSMMSSITVMAKEENKTASQEDFLNKCNYYLKHDNERRQIAANGYGKVKEFHTYEIRLKEIFEVVFSK